jgi:hypothetical protein
VSEPLTAGSFFWLKNGPVVRVEAIALLRDFEQRGIRLERDGDYVLVHAPANHVTAEDRATIRRFKAHVLALLDYFASAACTEAIQ